MRRVGSSMPDGRTPSSPERRVDAVEKRWPCPVCVGSRMAKVRVQEESTVLTLDACSRCGGLWFERGEVRRLARREPTALAALVATRAYQAHPPCHGCRAPLARDAQACDACGRRNVLPCPMCDRTMQRRDHAGITLDFCARCHGVWFDNAELSHIWRMTRAQQANVASPRRSTELHAAGTTGDGVLDAILWAPDLTMQGSVTVIHLVGHAADAAGDIVGGAAEGVFSLVLEIVVAVFEGW